MKNRLLNIIKVGIATAMSNRNSIYGILNNGIIFCPKEDFKQMFGKQFKNK